MEGTAQAAALNQEIEAAGGPIIDIGYSLIGEFQGPRLTSRN
jgi:hypothetical protein